MHQVTNQTTEINVDVQFQDPLTGTTTVEQCSITAFLIPPGADFQYTEVGGASANCTAATDTTILTHSYTPTSAGDYLYITSHVAFENPGGSTNQTWIEYPIGANAPAFNATDDWAIARDARQTYVSMRVESPGVALQTLLTRCNGSSGAGSTMLWAKVASFRLDAFKDDFRDEDLGEVTGVTSSTWTTLSTITQTAPASTRDYIMLGTISGCTTNTGSGATHGMRFRSGAAVEGDSVWGITRNCSDNQGYHNTFNWVEPYTTNAATTWDNQYNSTDNATEARFAESAIHILLFPARPLRGAVIVVD